MLKNNFYRAFEDKHRGSRKLIKRRLQVYLPFAEELSKIYPEALCLDIGCGRGEWLELLKDNKIKAQGVDLDKGMLESCFARGLDVCLGNGIEYLKKEKDNSKILVSAFHVVEHISIEELQELVEESFRVLKPGGILVLETPNAENIKVSTENFYTDPTHIKPIPASLLFFMTEYFGFKRNKILKLNEPAEIEDKIDINLMDVFGGVSPDYAVLAQKSAGNDVLDCFDDLFSINLGVSLEGLSSRFEERLLRIDAKVTKLEVRANDAEARANDAEARANDAEARANDAEARANDIKNSSTWKLFGPYRYCRRGISLIFSDISLYEKKIHIKRSIIFRVKANKFLYKNIRVLFLKFPGLYSFFIKYIKKDFVSDLSLAESNLVKLLSAREQKIYKDLLVAIEKGKK